MMTFDDVCGVCAGELPPVEEHPGAVCPTCIQAINEMNKGARE